jgi:hypothetical protein
MAAQAGMKPKEVDECYLEDAWIVIEGAFENYKDSWERTRALAFTIAQYSANGCKKKSPQELWPFAWDKKKTAAKYQDIIKRHALKKASMKK